MQLTSGQKDLVLRLTMLTLEKKLSWSHTSMSNEYVPQLSCDYEGYNFQILTCIPKFNNESHDRSFFFHVFKTSSFFDEIEKIIVNTKDDDGYLLLLALYTAVDLQAVESKSPSNDKEIQNVLTALNNAE